MSRDSAQNAGVFILHFALDNPLPKCAVIGRRRNRSLPRCRRIVRSVHHSQRTKYFALAEPVQAFIGDALQSDCQNDEADVTVFSPLAGISGECSAEGRCQQFVFVLRLEKESLVRRQSRRMRQQHPDGHVAAPHIASAKLRDDADYGRIQIDQSTLVENHRHRRGRHGLRNRSQIEYGSRSHCGSVRFVSKSAEGFQRD